MLQITGVSIHIDLRIDRVALKSTINELKEGVSNMEDFMQRIKKEINKGIATVSAKSKEIVDTVRIHNQISDLNDQKRQALEETGQVVYKMSLDKDYDGSMALKEKCQFIAELDEQVEAKEAELKTVYSDTQEAMGKICCQSCGMAVEEDVKFCSSCGTRIVKIEKD